MKLGLVLGGVAKGYMDATKQFQEADDRALDLKQKKAAVAEQQRVQEGIKAIQNGGTPASPGAAPAAPSSPAPSPQTVTAPTGAAAVPATGTASTIDPVASIANGQAIPTSAPITAPAVQSPSVMSNNWTGVQALAGGQNWPGQNGTDDNGNPTFANPMDSIHAGVNQVRNLGTAGIDNIADIANHWTQSPTPDPMAPPVDNSAMANHVSRVSGIAPSAPIDMSDHGQVNAVVHGIMSHNLGDQYPAALTSLQAGSAPAASGGAIPAPTSGSAPAPAPPKPSAVTQEAAVRAQQQLDTASKIATFKLSSSDPAIAESGARTLAAISAHRLSTIQAQGAEYDQQLKQTAVALNMARTPEQIEDAYQPFLRNGQTTAVQTSPDGKTIDAYIMNPDGSVASKQSFSDGLAADGKTPVSAMEQMRQAASAALSTENAQHQADVHVQLSAAAAEASAAGRAQDAEATKTKRFVDEGGVESGIKNDTIRALAARTEAGAAAENAHTNALEGAQRTHAMQVQNQITDANIADEKEFASPGTTGERRAQLQQQIAVRNGQLGVSTSQVTGPDGMPQTLYKGINGQQWTYDRSFGGMVDIQDVGQVKPVLAAAAKQHIPLTYGQWADPKNPADTGYAYAIRGADGQIYHGSDPGALVAQHGPQTKKLGLPTTAAPAPGQAASAIPTAGINSNGTSGLQALAAAGRKEAKRAIPAGQGESGAHMLARALYGDQ